MRSWLHNRQAHTIVEIMVAMALLTAVMGMGMSGWLYIVRGEMRNSTQAELDMDVRTTIEQLRSRLRLSSLGKIVFYRPAGAENFTAISFPLAVDSDGDGLIEMEGGTNIIWDKTVVYHVWNRSPEQLRCTTFFPRNNSLTEAQVRQQLADVVTTGNGSGTIDGSNATTQVVFANLFDWKLWPKGSKFDAYSSSLKRELVTFGSVVVTPGVHTLSFRTSGKNPSSSGYKVGLDYLRASPSGSDREAEWQSVLAIPSSVSPLRQYMTEGSWSDNYQMLFPATTTNQQLHFSIENDRWEETTFHTPGSLLDGVSLTKGTFGLSLEENAIAMDGNDYTWLAESQAPNTNASYVSDSDYDKCAVRVLMKGANIIDGGFISANGQYPYIALVSPSQYGYPYKRTRIRALSLGLVDDSDGYSTAMNLRTNTIRRMTYYSDTFDSWQWAWPETISPYYQISRTNTYAVTFYVDALGATNNGAIAFRQDPANKTHCYVLRNAAIADVYEGRWSDKTNLTTSSRIPVVFGMYTFYPSNAVFTSGIFDTTKDDPVFKDILWNESLGVTGSGYTDTPGSTALRMQVRSDDDPYMANAAAWSNVSVVGSSGSSLDLVGNGRFVQFRTTFLSDTWNAPKLRNVKIRWNGDNKMVDVSAMVTRGPDYGEFEVLLDGTNLYKGVRIDLSIFKDITGFGGKQTRMTSAMMAEVEPRNSEK